jgi:hypothetical protein
MKLWFCLIHVPFQNIFTQYQIVLCVLNKKELKSEHFKTQSELVAKITQGFTLFIPCISLKSMKFANIHLF